MKNLITAIKNVWLSVFPPFYIPCIFLMVSPAYSQGPAVNADWTFECQRDEIAPEYWRDKKNLFEGKSTLAMSGHGKSYVNGSWSHTLLIDPGQYYQFTAYFSAQKVDEPSRSILAKILWLDDEMNLTGFREYPAYDREVSEKGWSLIQQTYRTPENAKYAKIELIYRWDDDGTVYFSEAQLKKTEKPAPRLVRLAAIHYRPRNSNTAMENLEKFSPFLHEAGKKKADIVCLPEGTTVAGTGKSYVEVSEPVPGPSTEYLGKIAKQHQMYIVAGIYEREGPIVYNTSVLIGRNGEFVGKYRKVSLPREEIEGGITPGNSFPVFDTDFGRVGMMICWDVTFPEPASTLATKGAEVIFMPIWGGNINLARARAIENQVYLVSSTYSMKTGVFDLEGELIAEGTDENPVAIVEVDLNEQKLWPFLGEFKNRISRERPPNFIK